MTDHETQYILEMLSIAPGLRSRILADYLVSAEDLIGEGFSASRAIADLIGTATDYRGQALLCERGPHGLRNLVLAKYVRSAKFIVGDEFSTERAMSDLIKHATLLRNKFEKEIANV